LLAAVIARKCVVAVMIYQ